MKRRAAILPATVTGLTRALGIGVWLSAAPASPAVRLGPASVISSVTHQDVLSCCHTAAPGAVTTAHAECPSGSVGEWDAISGGYDMQGKDGIGVASATANYPGKLTEAPSWWVVVANPKAASSSVTFEVKVRCAKTNFATVAG